MSAILFSSISWSCAIFKMLSRYGTSCWQTENVKKLTVRMEQRWSLFMNFFGIWSLGDTIRKRCLKIYASSEKLSIWKLTSCERYEYGPVQNIVYFFVEGELNLMSPKQCFRWNVWKRNKLAIARIFMWYCCVVQLNVKNHFENWNAEILINYIWNFQKQNMGTSIICSSRLKTVPSFNNKLL